MPGTDHLEAQKMEAHGRLITPHPHTRPAHLRARAHAQTPLGATDAARSELVHTTSLRITPPRHASLHHALAMAMPRLHCTMLRLRASRFVAIAPPLLAPTHHWDLATRLSTIRPQSHQYNSVSSVLFAHRSSPVAIIHLACGPSTCGGSIIPAPHLPLTALTSTPKTTPPRPPISPLALAQHSHPLRRHAASLAPLPRAALPPLRPGSGSRPPTLRLAPPPRAASPPLGAPGPLSNPRPRPDSRAGPSPSPSPRPSASLSPRPRPSITLSPRPRPSLPPSPRPTPHNAQTSTRPAPDLRPAPPPLPPPSPASRPCPAVERVALACAPHPHWCTGEL